MDAEILNTLIKKMGLKDYPCSHLLSASEYNMLRVDTPNVPAEEFKTAIRWQVKDMLEYPVEEATVDALEIPNDGGSRQAAFMYAIAAPSNTLRQRIEMFNTAKLQLEVIDIPEMAQRNLAALFEQPGRALAALSFNADSEDCLLTFTAKGELYMTRRIDVSSQQLSDMSEDRRSQFLERLVLELQRSLDYFDREQRTLSLSELILAPFAGVTELQRNLAANLDANVSVMNLNNVLDFSEVPDLVDDIEGQGQLFSLFGAALRKESGIKT